VGEFATRVQERLREHLAAARPEYDWTTERPIAATPVDIAGENGALVVVELEWRRADPAANTAKLFRHLSTGTIDTDRVAVVQLFTGYYDLADGGVSSKRHDAEFVGSVAAETVDGLTYDPLPLDIDPPKRGGDEPGGWEVAVADAAADITARVP
jgi:hypothetical protein